MQLIKTKKLNKEEKQSILLRIKKLLEEDTNVVLAYLYGSFLKDEGFNDIDVAVYLNDEHFKTEDEIFKYELNLSAKVTLNLEKFEVDIKALNIAPLSFKFKVITSGNLLFTKDRAKLVDFETKTRDFYFDFLPYSKFFYKKIVLRK